MAKLGCIRCLEMVTVNDAHLCWVCRPIVEAARNFAKREEKRVAEGLEKRKTIAAKLEFLGNWLSTPRWFDDKGNIQSGTPASSRSAKNIAALLRRGKKRHEAWKKSHPLGDSPPISKKLKRQTEKDQRALLMSWLGPYEIRHLDGTTTTVQPESPIGAPGRKAGNDARQTQSQQRRQEAIALRKSDPTLSKEEIGLRIGVSGKQVGRYLKGL